MAVVGIAFFMSMPVIVGAWVDIMSFSVQEAGWLSSVDLCGFVIASITVSITFEKFDRRIIAASGLVLTALANIVCIWVTDFYPLLFLRLIAGTSAGLCYALGLANLAATHNTGRNFSILLFLQVSEGILAVNVLPYLTSIWGMPGIYSAIAIASLLSVPVCKYLPAFIPAEKQASPLSETSGTLPSYLRVLCLLAIFSFYIAITPFWTFIERVGNAANLGSDYINSTLSWTQLLSLVGCGLASWLSIRVGQSRPLLIAMLAIAGALLTLGLNVNEFTYVIALAVVFLLWNFIDIFQLGTLSNIDHSGHSTAMVPAVQGIAMTTGPALATLMLGLQAGFLPVFLMGGLFTLTAMTIYLFVYIKLIRIAPDIANSP